MGEAPAILVKSNNSFTQAQYMTDITLEDDSS